MYNMFTEFEMNSCCKQAMLVDGKDRKLELASSREKMEYFSALRRGNDQTSGIPTITNPDKHYLFNDYDTGLWRVLKITLFCWNCQFGFKFIPLFIR